MAVSNPLVICTFQLQYGPIEACVFSLSNHKSIYLRHWANKRPLPLSKPNPRRISSFITRGFDIILNWSTITLRRMTHSRVPLVWACDLWMYCTNGLLMWEASVGPGLLQNARFSSPVWLRSSPTRIVRPWKQIFKEIRRNQIIGFSPAMLLSVEHSLLKTYYIEFFSRENTHLLFFSTRCILKIVHLFIRKFARRILSSSAFLALCSFLYYWYRKGQYVPICRLRIYCFLVFLNIWKDDGWPWIVCKYTLLDPAWWEDITFQVCRFFERHLPLVRALYHCTRPEQP